MPGADWLHWFVNDNNYDCIIQVLQMLSVAIAMHFMAALFMLFHLWM